MNGLEMLPCPLFNIIAFKILKYPYIK